MVARVHRLADEPARHGRADVRLRKTVLPALAGRDRSRRRSTFHRDRVDLLTGAHRTSRAQLAEFPRETSQPPKHGGDVRLEGRSTYESYKIDHASLQGRSGKVGSPGSLRVRTGSHRYQGRTGKLTTFEHAPYGLGARTLQLRGTHLTASWYAPYSFGARTLKPREGPFASRDREGSGSRRGSLQGPNVEAQRLGSWLLPPGTEPYLARDVPQGHPSRHFRPRKRHTLDQARNVPLGNMRGSSARNTAHTIPLQAEIHQASF